MDITKHATDRIQQRGIPPLVIDLLIKFGSSEPAGDGACKIFADKRARRQIKAFAGPLARAIDPHLDVYVVLGAKGNVITTAPRTARIHRH